MHLIDRIDPILVRDGRTTIVLDPLQLDWAESAGNYIVLHSGNQNHILRFTMRRLEARLAPFAFLRASRSALVNPRRIQSIRKLSGGKYALVLNSGIEVPTTQTLRFLKEQFRFSDLSTSGWTSVSV